MLAAAELLRRPQTAVPALIARSAVSAAVTASTVPGAAGQPVLRLALVDPDRLAEPDDRSALKRLFEGMKPSTGIVFDRGDERLANRLVALQTEAAATLRSRRLATGPRSAATWTLRVVTFLAMAVALAVLLDVMIRAADPVRAIVAVVVLVAGALALRPARMPERLTRRGAALRDRLVAFGEHLEHEERLLPWFVLGGLDTSWSNSVPADALVTLGAFGHTVASERVGGPIVLPGMATADGLWSGSAYYDTVGRLESSGASR